MLQRLVRRHQGVDAARSVFSNARRTLQVREEDLSSENEDGTGVSAATKQKDGINKDETNDDGDHEKFAHYVQKEKIVESAVTGKPVIALCGKVWVPGRDPAKFPICPDCKKIFDSLK